MWRRYLQRGTPQSRGYRSRPAGHARFPLRTVILALTVSLLPALLPPLLPPLPTYVAQASPVEVVKAVFERSGGEWRVSVTLRHADSGWEHYANVWVVESLDGRELGRRVLLHPHEHEQPFTRSLRLNLPPGIAHVRVRAGDNVNGMEGNTVVVNLTQARGERFQVRQ